MTWRFAARAASRSGCRWFLRHRFSSPGRTGFEPVGFGPAERGGTRQAGSLSYMFSATYNPLEASLITRSASSAKQMAALGSIGSALVLVALKVFLAASTGSLGVLSEALHSGLDLIAAILTWLSVRVSDRPADSGHTYGHGKFENFSAFVETGLLLATSVYIIG